MSEVIKRRLELSLTAVFVAALLLVGAVLIFSGGRAAAKQVATLRIYQGQVLVQRGTGPFTAGEDGASLREGDTVRTALDGRAAIEYFDGSATRLDFASTFTIITLETLRNAVRSTVIEGEQHEGNSYNLVAEFADAVSRFEVETPTATAAVQGTVYAILLNPTRVVVIDGSVTVITDEGEIEVPAGKIVEIELDGTIGALQEIPEELLSTDWFTWNECELDQEGNCVPAGISDEPDASPSPDAPGGAGGNPQATITTTPPQPQTTPPSITPTDPPPTQTRTTPPPTSTSTTPPPTTTTTPTTTATTSPPPAQESVTICHATGSGSYNRQTVAASSIVRPGGHGGHADDIIPPFTYGDPPEQYPGKNWNAIGQAIYHNGCVDPNAATGQSAGAEVAVGLALLLPALPALGLIRRRRR